MITPPHLELSGVPVRESGGKLVVAHASHVLQHVVHLAKEGTTKATERS